MRLSLMTCVLALAAAAAFAQPAPGTASAAPAMPPGAMPGMAMPRSPAAANAAPSTRAYQEAMAKMDRGMAIMYTGDPDADFVAGMIPHHEGAIDMARVELRYGHDKVLKRLAHEIIEAQTKEIAFMRRWQAQHRK